MPKSSSMESAYKVLEALMHAHNGMSEGEIKRRFPFLDIDSIIQKLETPGYISHRISGYQTTTTKISHDYNDRWYPTDLGITALEQYKESRPSGNSKKLLITLGIVSAACVFVIYLILNSPPV